MVCDVLNNTHISGECAGEDESFPEGHIFAGPYCRKHINQLMDVSKLMTLEWSLEEIDAMSYEQRAEYISTCTHGTLTAKTEIELLKEQIELLKSALGI